MPLYERNSIQNIELINKPGIYASFACEEDNTYDYLLLEEISRAVIVPIEMDTINKVTCKKGRTEIAFSCEFDRNKDAINVKVYALLNEFRAKPAEIEIQDFTDALCSTIYDNKPFEEHEYIEEVKRKAIDNLMNEMFKSTCELAVNQSYDFVGKIMDINNQIVGIINSFLVSTENNDFIITLDKVVSYMSLKDIDVSKIDFLTGEYSLVINDFEILDNIEGIVKTYKLKVKNCYSKESNEPIIAETSKQIIDYDFFFDERALLLADKSAVFKNNSSDMKAISSLFADFDF